MVVYADVLVALNIIVTYFILLATKKISHATTKTYKLVVAAFVGGLSSLYIFLPQQSFFLETFIKLLFSAVITVIAFGAAKIKRYIRCVFSFYAVSFLYAGFMLGFWYVLRPAGMVINNGVVYFSISPVALILSTVVCYSVITVAQLFYKRGEENAQIKTVRILRSGSEYELRCMVDTGNSISDPLGNARVIIAGRSKALELFGENLVQSALELSAMQGQKMRLLPYKTAMGEGIMPALCVDAAMVDGERYFDVIIGILKQDFGDFDAIISPAFFD